MEKHLQIETPVKIGILYHKYKGLFNVALLAICKAKWTFAVVDVAQYDSNNYSDVLAFSKMRYVIKNNSPHTTRWRNSW